MESFSYCFTKVPIISSVFRAPLLLADLSCNHLPEDVVAEAKWEVFLFSYGVAAHKAGGMQSSCL